MFAACVLLFIAVLGGTLLTFLFDRTAPFAARVCMGACIGLALLTTAGFLLALWLGLNPGSIIIGAVILFLPLLLLFHRVYREVITRALLSAMQSFAAALRHPGRRTAAYFLFYCCMAVLLGLIFARAVYQRPDGIFTGIANNLGDLPLHLKVITSFAQGNNFPPEDPTFAGVRFAYPFLVDFLAAMLARAGAGVIGAMWIENMVLGLALIGLTHYWTLLLTRNRLAGLIAPLLVVFSGGLGCWLIFSDASNSSSGILSLLGNLPHDYTIMPNSIFRWGNSLTTLIVPQRSILFGMPLAICIFSLWWLAVSQQESASENQAQQTPMRRMVAAGLCAGLMPLIHAHAFLVVMGVGACLALAFRSAWKSWLLFFVIALVVALPEVRWLARSGGVNAQSYMGWQPGWDRGDHNALWFWFVNTGLFIPLLLWALARRRPEQALPRRLLRFYVPFLLCFIVPNLVKLAPWIWDNIKVLFFWYIASVPLVALLLARWWQQKSGRHWLAAVALAALVLAGGLDILRVIMNTTEYQEFDIHGIAVANVISQQVPPRALVLHAPTYNSPVFLTGRRSLLGYPGWMWSRGLDYSQRGEDIQRMYSGGPEAEALLSRYRVEYVLISPAELMSLKVNEQFWSRYPKMAQIGEYRLYKTNVPEERAGK